MTTIERWDEVPERTVFPGFHGRFIHSGQMTFARWRIDAGATLPEHSHLHEQVVHTYSGELRAHRRRRHPPAHRRHGADHPAARQTLGPRDHRPATVMDAFSPVREDYR